MYKSKAYKLSFVKLASAPQIMDAVESSISALGKAQSEEKQALAPINAAIDRYIDARDLADKSLSLLKDLANELGRLGVDVPRDFGMVETRAKNVKAKSENKIKSLQRASKELR